MADRLFDLPAKAAVWLVFAFCRLIDPEFAAWSNFTDGDAS